MFYSILISFHSILGRLLDKLQRICLNFSIKKTIRWFYKMLFDIL